MYAMQLTAVGIVQRLKKFPTLPVCSAADRDRMAKSQILPSQRSAKPRPSNTPHLSLLHHHKQRTSFAQPVSRTSIYSQSRWPSTSPTIPPTPTTPSWSATTTATDGTSRSDIHKYVATARPTLRTEYAKLATRPRRTTCGA
jgi:hypothetical protein